MELEKQVVSLELAKRMKELGFEQDSLFYWVQLKDSSKWDIWFTDTENLDRDFASSYTVAELGEMLPWRSKKMGTVNNAELVFTKLMDSERNDLWNVGYWDEDSDHLYGGMVVRIENEKNSEANARAKMLIYLKENKLI